MTIDDTSKIVALISGGESLSTEFKSDKKSLPDRELIAAVVSLANTEGGVLLLGVEDSGVVTGLHPNHLDVFGIQALVANRTNPSLSVSVERIVIDGRTIAQISVNKSPIVIATTDGLIVRRRLKHDGLPEAVPFFPHEFSARRAGFGAQDPSANIVAGVNVADLDPLQRLRIRNSIRNYGGDQKLLQLDDRELDGALGLVTESEGEYKVTIAGLLMLGSEPLLRRYLPSHEVAFQVLKGTDVVVNQFFRGPLLDIFEQVEVLFKARVEEAEIQVGLFRMAVPNFDAQAFREAFVNALVHRDYGSLGAVHVRFDDDGLTISNPGGFVEGVTLDNFLVVPPRSRNPLLADIMKRIGLAERTARGIDRIFERILRHGRIAPDYSYSSSFSVIVRFAGSEPDLNFVQMIVREEDKAGVHFGVDALIVLSKVREERRVSITQLADALQKPVGTARGVVERLVERGLLEPHGTGKGRSYTLSAKIYQHHGLKAAYVRQAGFDRVQQEQMVLNYIDTHKEMKRADVIDLCQLSRAQAYGLLGRLVRQGYLLTIGKGKGTRYVRRS